MRSTVGPLKQSLDSFNQLVRQAQERVTERRADLIVWGKNSVLLRPGFLQKARKRKPTAEIRLGKGSWIRVSLPAALLGKPPAEWIFYRNLRTGDCPIQRPRRGMDGQLLTPYSAA